MNTAHNTVLITGGAKGIGLALARRFHRAGNQVILVGRDALALDEAAMALPGARVCVADVSDAEDRSRMVQAHPDVNILVNNAGIQFTGRFETMSASDILRELATNLIGPVMLTHLFLPQLRLAPSAAIVNVSSLLGLMPKQEASIYSASKAALHSFTQSLRWQLEASHVRIFEIVPPLVDTAMAAESSKRKLSPDAVADAFWGHFKQGTPNAYVGQARSARLLIQLLPALAERLIRFG